MVGGPTLDWFVIQPKLSHSEADVLLLLDCCFGAQAARGRQIPSRVELLAASAMGVKALPPGPRSFTAALLKELKDVPNSTLGITVSELHRRLCHRNADLLQTPVHVDLGSGTRKSIKLKQLNAGSIIAAEEVKGPQLNLQVTLRDVITKASLPTIINWLKHDAPPIVSRMTVQSLVSTTEKVQKFIFSDEGQGRGPLSVNSLENSAKNDILQAWEAFASLLARAELILHTDRIGSNDSTLNIAPTEREDVSLIKELNTRLSELLEIIKETLLRSEKLFDREYLLQLTDNASPDDLGLTELLKMRLMALFPETQSSYAEEDTILQPAIPASIGVTSIVPGDLPDLGLVLIEYKGASEGDAAVARQANLRVKQLANLLSASKPEEFRALKCLKSFQLPDQSGYGLAFAIPEGCLAQPTPLSDLIRTMPTTQRPSLGQRFNIAFKLAQAVGNWHRVGWVLQSIATHNVILFKRQNGEGSPTLALTSPYLCGFEYSRPNAAPSHPRVIDNYDSALYCHPDRQGLPSKHHQKIHDLYSLGVVLLEIGLWRHMSEVFPKSRWIKVTPADIKRTFIKNAEARLAHYMGCSYSRAVVACLTGDFGVKLDDESESRLSASFNRMVISGLGRGIGID